MTATDPTHRPMPTNQQAYLDAAAAAGLGAPTGAAASAEVLVYLLHRGADWSVWGTRATRYWDALAERVRAATYAGPTLDHWWDHACTRLPSQPRDAHHRAWAAAALGNADHRATLDLLHDTAVTLVLRVRVLNEHLRGHQGDTL